MASLRIVGIDPGTSGANQLAAQGLDTVLINDIHGSTVLNLVSTASNSSINMFAGGTAASNKVLSLLSAGSAVFNPSTSSGFQGVLVQGGTGFTALSVNSPATTTQPTLKVTQLGTSNALEVFGTGAAILQMGDSGTFLYNKTNSDMELFTYGLGSTFLQGGALGTMEIRVETNAVSNGGGVYITGGASSSFANNGGLVSIAGGPTNSVNAVDTGGPVTINGGASSNASSLGGDVTINGGNNSASPVSTKFGSLSLGTATTRNITIGGVSNAGTPGTISVVGQGTSSAAGGDVIITSGSNTAVTNSAGSLFLHGGSSALGTGGGVELKGGNSSSVTKAGGVVSIQGGIGGSATYSSLGIISIGTLSANTIQIGGLQNGTAGAGIPGDVSMYGHFITEVGSIYRGGNVNVVAGSTSAPAASGGAVTINAGASTSSGAFTYKGSISIGTSNTGLITVGGTTTTDSSADASLVLIRGHSISSLSTIQQASGGSVQILGGDTQTHAPSGVSTPAGSIIIDPGKGFVSPDGDGTIQMLSNNGDTILIGNGTVVPKVKIVDGYLSFTNTASGSDSNPPYGTGVTRNALYAKNTVSAWVRAFSYNNSVRGFGVTSLVPSGSNIIVTFSSAAVGSIDQALVAVSGGGTGIVVKAVPTGVNSALMYAYNSAGSPISMAGVSWYLVRLSED